MNLPVNNGFTGKMLSSAKNSEVSKKSKIIWTISGVVILILVMFLANFFVRQKIKKELDSQLQASAYKDLSVNIFLNTFSIENVEVEKGRFAGKADKIALSGLSYYKYLFKDKVEIDELELVSPKVRIFPKDTSTTSKKDRKKEVLINNISVKDGSFSRVSNDTAAATFYTHVPTARVRNVNTGMPISEVDSYQLEVDTLFMKIGPEHYIDVGNLSANDGQVDIYDLKIRSFFPREDFVQRIPFEKDYVNLDVKQIRLDSLDFEMRKDSLYVKNQKMTVAGAHLNIYRNKTVADYPNVKPLYSKMLREAPLFLNFEKVVVKDSEIVYEEQVKAGERAATVRFAAVNGEINNLHNLKELSSQPKITASANFMQGTPVSIDWTFPVFNLQDKFQISGNFGTIQGEALDPFLIPSLSARARGTINSVYFNFFGNDDVMQGDFKIEYDDLKVELLTKEKEEKKGFLSSIANLFVDNEQEPEEGGSRDVRVERTKNKSFWNYAWKGLRKGLLKAVGQL